MGRPTENDGDEAMLLALASGSTLESAAEAGGMSLSTVKRRLREPEFQQRLQAIRTEIVGRTAAILSAGSPVAAKVLMALQNESHPPTVRLGAARAVIELALRFRVEEFDQRLTGLEAMVVEWRRENGK